MKIPPGHIGANKMAAQYIEAQTSVQSKMFLAGQIAQWAEVIKDDLAHDKLEAMREVMEVMDKAIKDSGRDHSCKKGCNFCCRMNVDILPEEAELIAVYCASNDIVISKEYLKKQMKVRKEMIAFSAVGVCVFLKDGLCSIYPVRPLACRKYLVASPAEDCDIKNYGYKKVAVVCDISVEVLDSAFTCASSGEAPIRLPKALLPYSK